LKDHHQKQNCDLACNSLKLYSKIWRKADFTQCVYIKNAYTKLLGKKEIALHEKVDLSLRNENGRKILHSISKVKQMWKPFSCDFVGVKIIVMPDDVVVMFDKAGLGAMSEVFKKKTWILFYPRPWLPPNLLLLGRANSAFGNYAFGRSMSWRCVGLDRFRLLRVFFVIGGLFLRLSAKELVNLFVCADDSLGSIVGTEFYDRADALQPQL
jgi:hypothetical protein